MRFVDEVKVRVIGGAGGNGAVAFRREKFVPFGGPAGGDGGKGGHVVLEGDEGLTTLLDLRYAREIKAERGANGEGKDKYGRAGKDRVVRVPVGTQVYDEETGDLVGDITEHEQRLIVARGGKGGWGNLRFVTATDRAPRRADPGGPGEQRELRLELKVLADIGLLGFPNAGKSTFISVVSAARPKIADYPFTTLTPNLGVVSIGGGPRRGGTTVVVADIPGLIPGASDGAGLGHRFLRHIERTQVLLHLVALDPDPQRDPLDDYRALRTELKRFDPMLALRPELVALTKADIPEVKEAFPAVAQRFEDEIGIRARLISSATREGIDELIDDLARMVFDARRNAEEATSS
ncbi:MAG: GTPase ObgE [Myxococcota bacterium]